MQNMQEHEQYISYRDIMSGADFVTNAILIFRIAYSTVMFYEIVNSVSKIKKKNGGMVVPMAFIINLFLNKPCF